MKKTVLTLAALIGLSAGGALAQSAEFNAIDADGDGFISFAELQLALPDLTEDVFASFDLDGDGVLSPEEFEAIVAPQIPEPLQ